jgi:phospholipase C
VRHIQGEPQIVAEVSGNLWELGKWESIPRRALVERSVECKRIDFFCDCDLPPQYFGYVTNNPAQSSQLHGLGDFFDDMQNSALPRRGGVFYVRGGYDNITGLKPSTAYAVGPTDAAYISANFLGDDDHPAYSDAQISEALVANEVNAIANSKYWGESAIVITYDESEGDYDHVPQRILSYDPAGLPPSRGSRIPLIVISPYTRVHAVAHEEGGHNSVIRLVNSLFGLPPLANLPDEAGARLAGAQGAQFQTGPAGFTQTFLGPHDAPGIPTGILLSTFDPGRLIGYRSPLPASYATILAATVNTLPRHGDQGCSALNLKTEDRVQGIANAIPPDFYARPSQTPS